MILLPRHVLPSERSPREEGRVTEREGSEVRTELGRERGPSDSEGARGGRAEQFTVPPPPMGPAAERVRVPALL